MPQVTCSRCGSTVDALPRAPLPGAHGERLLHQTCPSCWKAWMDAQVILMNERKLSPGDPEHYDLLIREMTTFLNLQDE